MSKKEANSNSKSSSQKGNPFQRGKTWTFIVYVLDSATGKKKQKWHGGYPTKAEAQKALEITKAQIRLGQYKDRSKQTVGSYITSWFEDIHKPTIKPTTARGYEVNIRLHIVPSLGDIPLDKLNRQDIIRLHNTMQANRSRPATILYVHRVLSMGLKEAVLSDLIPKNPCDGVRLPKKARYKAPVLNPEQSRRLISEARHLLTGMGMLLAPH